jgi:hypothetical protein
VITTDRGGPAFVVDDKSGVRLPVTTPEEFSRDLAETIRRFALSPVELQQLSDGAMQRIAQVGLWSSKIDQMLGLYREINSTTTLCA